MLQHHDPHSLHVYTEHGRFYRVRDKLYPGISNIQDAINPDATKKWNEWSKNPKNAATLAAACERGTLFHQAIEKYLTDLLWDDEDDEQLRKSPVFPYIKSVQDVLPLIDNPQLIESAVWHPILSYAGTVDLVAEYEGTLSIIDWKTSQYPKREVPERHLLQLAAYCGAINRMYGLRIQQGIIVAANPKEAAQVTKVDLNLLFKRWINKVIQYWQMQKPTPEVEQVLAIIKNTYSVARPPQK